MKTDVLFSVSVRRPSLAFALAFALLVLLSACSSTPAGQSDQVVDIRNGAAQNAAFGNNYYQQGNYVQALEFFTQALEANVSIDYQQGIASSYNSIGLVYLATRNFDEAESSFRKAERIATTLGDMPLLARTENNLGRLSVSRASTAEEYRAVIPLFQQALARVAGERNSEVAAEILGNLGTTFIYLEDIAQADTNLQQALAINIANRNHRAAAVILYYLALASSRAGDYPSALDFANQALEKDRWVENSMGIARDLLAIGQIQIKAQDYASAFDSLERAFDVYHVLNQSTYQVRVLRLLISTAGRLDRSTDAEYYTGLLETLDQETVE